MKRIKTYISGFDELIEGGFPIGSENLILGNAGTGKTIFSLEYLYKGANIAKETGIYFTFEEKRENLLEQASQFGWDLEKLEKEEKIKIISLGFNDITKNTSDEVVEIVRNLKATRVVIDSISTLSYLTPQNSLNGCVDPFAVRKFMYEFIAKLRELKDVTSLIISQNEDDEVNVVAKYICDSIVKIEYDTLGGDFSRNIVIRKIRKTKNDEDLHPLEISKKGLIVHNLD